MALYVEASGTPGAPSIVWLHGVGASGWMWWRQIPTFADFHCLNVDLPGHGKSNHIPWVSLKDTADQVAEVIRTHATHGQAHIVGLSLGAYVALVLLEHHTALIQRLVLSGVTAAPMPNKIFLTPQVWMMSLMKTSPIARMQARALNLPPQIQTAFTKNLQAMSIQTYRRIITEVVDYRVSPALREITNPTLITAGGKESKIILDAVQAIPRLMPNAQGRLAPGLTHGWNVQDPDLFSAMVRAWVSDTPLPARLQAVSSK